MNDIVIVFDDTNIKSEIIRDVIGESTQEQNGLRWDPYLNLMHCVTNWSKNIRKIHE